MSSCEYCHEDGCILHIITGEDYDKCPCKWAKKETEDSIVWFCTNYNDEGLIDEDEEDDN